MTHLESLEAKMASIEVSLSNANTPRRRKGTSLGGASTRSSPRPPMAAADTISLQSNGKQELRSALQEREAIIQNLRMQLGLGKLPRPTGTPLNETERPVAELRLQKLRNEADNKRVAIRNLKCALEKLDITDNIDVRIRQAELEYALGREELHLLSVVEEIRSLQSRLDKSLKADTVSGQNSLFAMLQNGVNLSMHATKATVGRFGVNARPDATGLYVEWVLDGESLFRGDRIIECNGKVIGTQTKEEFHKLANVNGKCEVVVVRKRPAQHNQQLQQTQEDNQRLQHRISYLEDQVKELQHSTKEMITAPSMQNGHHTNGVAKAVNSSASAAATLPSHGHAHKNTKGDHVTSINISSAPISSKDSEKPQIYQRGNFVATIIGGKAVQSAYQPTHQITTQPKSMHTTKTVIKDTNGLATSESDHDLHYRVHRTPNGLQHSQSQQYIGTSSKLFGGSTSKISIGNEPNSLHSLHNSHSMTKHREKQRDQYKENRRLMRETIDRHNSHPNLLNGSAKKPDQYAHDQQRVEHSDIYSEVESGRHSTYRKNRQSCDMRSAKSLDFEKEMKLNVSNTPHKQTAAAALYRRPIEVDYTSEPVATPLSNSARSRNSSRPAPPKKPLRLSLQRTQSLQTIEMNAASDIEKKRAIKRTHRGNKTPDLPHLLENGSNLHQSMSNGHLHTASLGRHLHN